MGSTLVMMFAVARLPDSHCGANSRCGGRKTVLR
jgi:hypothetical protein